MLRVLILGIVAVGTILSAQFLIWHFSSEAAPSKMEPALIEYTTSSVTKVFEMSPVPEPEELLSYIPDFIETPEGGVSWEPFGATGQDPYSYFDEDGMEWSGVRPVFSDELQKLDGQEILMQGYMFPLDPSEKQSMFLFGPFPISCPYHYHVTPNLIIEVHAKYPVTFSYDAVDVKGKLELVPKDDEYNIFYRLKEVEILS